MMVLIGLEKLIFQKIGIKINIYIKATGTLYKIYKKEGDFKPPSFKKNINLFRYK